MAKMRTLVILGRKESLTSACGGWKLPAQGLGRGMGMDIEDIQRKLVAGQFEFSLHGLKRIVERNISENEIRRAGQSAEMIEDYPDDKYSPSCLVLGFTEDNRPLHLQVCYSSADMLKIVTIYEPTEEDWMDFRIRRSK